MAPFFKVVTREIELPKRQVVADVVREDGMIVRNGLHPDYAEADCELLNRCMSEGWDGDKYLAERIKTMRKVRQ